MVQRDRGPAPSKRGWIAAHPLLALILAGAAGLVAIVLFGLTATTRRSVGQIAVAATPTVQPAPALPGPSTAPTAAASAPTALPFGVAAPADPKPPPPPTSPPAPTPAPMSGPTGERLTVRGAGAEGVNLRIEPSATSARVKLLLDGTVLEIIGDDEESDGRTWRKVRDVTDGATGWIAAEFVAAAAPPTATAPAPAPPTQTVEPPPTPPPATPAPTTQIAAPPTAAGTTAPNPTAAAPPTAGTTPTRLPVATAALNPTAPAPKPVAPAPKPTGSRAAPQGNACPAGFPIKGNHAATGERIYHPPGGQFYGRTWPEDCFATEADARAAGYRASLR